MEINRNKYALLRNTNSTTNDTPHLFSILLVFFIFRRPLAIRRLTLLTTSQNYNILINCKFPKMERCKKLYLTPAYLRQTAISETLRVANELFSIYRYVTIR